MESEFIIFLILLLITGVFSGLIAGLLGVGGGIVIIPVVFYILNFYNYSNEIIMHVAISSSLGVISLTSISSMYAHYKLGNIQIYVLKKWFFGIIIGSICGAICASSIDVNLLIIIFSLITSVIAISMFLNINILLKKEIPNNFFKNTTISFLIGFFSVLIGIGGGSFSVPTLTAFGKNIHQAVGTSSSIGFLIAFPGFMTYASTGWMLEGLPKYSLGYVSLPIVLSVASVSIFTAPLGAKISNNIRKNILKKFFAIFLLSICATLIIDQFYLN